VLLSPRCVLAFLDLLFVVVDLTVRRRPVRKSTPLCQTLDLLTMKTSDSFSAMMTIDACSSSPTVACVAMLELLPSALPLLMRGGAGGDMTHYVAWIVDVETVDKRFALLLREPLVTESS
jgi:hypothetical protein